MFEAADLAGVTRGLVFVDTDHGIVYRALWDEPQTGEGIDLDQLFVEGPIEHPAQDAQVPVDGRVGDTRGRTTRSCSGRTPT